MSNEMKQDIVERLNTGEAELSGEDWMPYAPISASEIRDNYRDAAAEITRLRELLNRAVKALDHYGPAFDDGHSCGPDSCCDMSCVEIRQFNANMMAYRAALAARPSPEAK